MHDDKHRQQFQNGIESLIRSLCELRDRPTQNMEHSARLLEMIQKLLPRIRQSLIVIHSKEINKNGPTGPKTSA